MRTIPFAVAVAVLVILAAVGMIAAPANVVGQTIPYPTFATIDPLTPMPTGECGEADWCFPGPTKTPEGATPAPTATVGIDPANPPTVTPSPFPIAPCPPLRQCFPALPRLVFLPRIVQASR